MSPGTASGSRVAACAVRGGTKRHTPWARPWALVLAAALVALAGCGGRSGTTTTSTTTQATAPARTAPPATPRPPARPDFPADVDASFAGQGAQGAWVFRRKGTHGDPVVLFLHGWTAVNPELYGPWLTHLVRKGSTVVYPIYQDAPFLAPTVAYRGVVAGVRAALREDRLSRKDWVLAGHSAGAAMSADYAATAKGLGLPPARAIFSAYPGRMLPRIPLRLPEAADPATIPRTTRIVVFYGTNDRTVGDKPAKRIFARAHVDHEQLVRVDDPAVNDHLGPQRSGPETRKVFWRRLDALIARARG